MRRIVVIAVATCALALGLAACGDDDGGGGSCESICQQAQALNCTSITDCNMCCAVGSNLASKAGCNAEYNALHSCSQSVPVCSIDSECGSEENALAYCVAPFCLANQNDPDCIAVQDC